jgi:predicted RNA-binding protein with PIN domain
MEPLLILIDGYNVIRNTPSLLAAHERSAAVGREALLTQVVATYRHTPHTAVVVFDGDGASERTEAVPRTGRIRVIYTARGHSADDTLVRLSAEAQATGKRVKVVTDDGELVQRANAYGATTARPAQLADRLNQPSRDVVKKHQYRSAVQRQWEKGADGEHERREKKGNPRKAPKRRRGVSNPGL